MIRTQSDDGREAVQGEARPSSVPFADFSNQLPSVEAGASPMTDNTPSCSLTLTKVMFGSYITFGIDARDFHRELAVTEEFSEWIKVRIASHKFLENQDFISREKSDRQLNGTPELDYVISIDMANQMAFNELSPNRAQVRRFLLDAERLSTSQLISTYRATFDRQLDEIIDLKVNKSVNKSLPLLLAQMLTDRRIQVRYGKTAGQIWKDKGFPSLRLHQWFGNKLEKSGCLVEGN